MPVKVCTHDSAQPQLTITGFRKQRQMCQQICEKIMETLKNNILNALLKHVWGRGGSRSWAVSTRRWVQTCFQDFKPLLLAFLLYFRSCWSRSPCSAYWFGIAFTSDVLPDTRPPHLSGLGTGTMRTLQDKWDKTETLHHLLSSTQNVFSVVWDVVLRLKWKTNSQQIK